MFDVDWIFYLVLVIFVKDFGIVLNEVKRLVSYTFMFVVVYNFYIDGVVCGWVRELDVGVVCFWEIVRLDVSKSVFLKVMFFILYEDVIKLLFVQVMLVVFFVEYVIDFIELMRVCVDSGVMLVFVVLDDDFIGIQICNNIDVLVVWDVEIFKE